jgi:hypothetical protein
MSDHTQVYIPHLKQSVVLVPREQLRQTRHGRMLAIPRHLFGLLSSIPNPPPFFDGSRGRGISYPIMGNDRYGCCYYADMVHCTQTWTGNVGQEAQFNVNQMIARYLKLSGGDNGLGDRQVFPEWKSGIIGPNGPHKILDDMTIDPRDDQSIQLGQAEFCGVSYTASLLTSWLSNPQPGQVWDATGRPNPQAGHAMHLSGFVSKGQPLPFANPLYSWPKGSPSPNDFYFDETWGFETPIFLTPAGLKASDPEITVQYSRDFFNPKTGLSFDKKTWWDKRQLWQQLGGQDVGDSPFPTPKPDPTPTPPVPTPPGPTPGPNPWADFFKWLMSQTWVLDFIKFLITRYGRFVDEQATHEACKVYIKEKGL